MAAPISKTLRRTTSSSYNGEVQNGTYSNGAVSSTNPELTLISRIKQDKLYQKISARDRHRLENEKWWLDRILESCHNDEDVAYVVMMECLRWRVAFDVECEHGISLLSLKELLDRQLMYIHGRDLDGINILWLNLRHYIAGEHGFEQLFAFWIERHYMDTRGAPLAVLIDMTETKPRNMDMNSFKFVLKMAKYYYPGSIRDIFVYNSPNILSAPWKVISSWIEEGHPGITHIDKDSIIDYIHPDHLRPELGGDDTFLFTMAEIAKCLPPPSTDDDGFVDSFCDAKANTIDDFNRRSVTFGDPESPGRREPLTMVRRPPSRGPGSRRNTISGSVKMIADKRLQAPEWFTCGPISFSPKEEVQLQKVEGENDLVDTIVVKNTSNQPWMFKIKTTSPEKFRVRPSTGIVQPNATEVVRVYLQSEYRHSCAREKFLVMAIETLDTQLEKFAEIWRTSAAPKVEHKLKCKVLDNGGGDNRPERRSSLLSSQQEQIDAMQKDLRNLVNTQRLVIIVIAFLFAILFISMLYERSNHESLRTSIEALAIHNAKVLTTPVTPPVPVTDDEL